LLLDLDAFSTPLLMSSPPPQLDIDTFAIPLLTSTLQLKWNVWSSGSPPLSACKVTTLSFLPLPMDFNAFAILLPSALPGGSFAILPPQSLPLMDPDPSAIHPPTSLPPANANAFAIPLHSSLLDMDVFASPLPTSPLQKMDAFYGEFVGSLPFLCLVIMLDFRFTEVPDSAESEIDISTAYIDFPPDHPISPPSSLTYIYGTESSVHDADDDEILSHCPLSPPAKSPDVDEDEDTPVLSQTVQ
jgi:hypothetical protein